MKFLPRSSDGWCFMLLMILASIGATTIATIIIYGVIWLINHVRFV